MQKVEDMAFQKHFAFSKNLLFSLIKAQKSMKSMKK